MFCYIDEISDFPRMDPKYKKDLHQWKTKRTKNDGNWFVLPLVGTTFSGHPTRTTLGNTLRSIAYSYYYMERAGILNPWNDEKVHVIASGDDVVFWVGPDKANDVRDAIILNTAQTKDLQVVGLGQVVKTVDVKEWYEVDF